MGRPRTHDQQTAELLLDCAERMLEASTADRLSIRALATETGTSTRAVYSTFGSKDELLTALAARAFEILDREVRSLPATDDPAVDLVAAGLVFRRLAIEHPALLRLAFSDRGEPAQARWPGVRSAQLSSLGALRERVARVLPAGAGDAAIAVHTTAFHALSEGLAALQLRGVHVSAVWQESLATLVRGMVARS